MEMTQEAVVAAISGLIGDGATADQIGAALLANGATWEQVQSGMEQAKFDAEWGQLLAAVTAQYPEVGVEQVAAMKSFIDQGFGFDTTNLPRCGKKFYAILAAGDTASMVPAMAILLGTLFKIQPQLKAV